MIRKLITILVLINLSTPLALKNSLFVRTTAGVLEGTSVKINGNQVQQFLGVPYAKPPVGPLRFQRPEPLTATSSTVMDATKFQPTCVQMKHISETINPLLNVDEEHKKIACT
ncbi:carboxylesterase-like protein 1 [Leptotrombidium deliense]|uniref:Carboxylesterase-like protein 1 n=1 Tax=Leptotrombidium deliense TaxID=299467 RepID=A0A443SJH6_9ACAR|nr:carboxylesterase-like protein 1 [Leptotrombidium deliense]